MNLKHYPTLIAVILCSFQAYSQPTDAAILKKLSTNSNNPDHISTSLSKKGNIEKEIQNGKTVTTYTRWYSSKLKTEWSGVTRVYSAAIIYESQGGSWVYRSKTVGNNSFLGMSDPTIQEITTLINQDQIAFIGPISSKSFLTKLQDIKFADEPKMYWPKPTNVELNITAVYDKKGPSPKIMTMQGNFRLKLERDDINAPWKIIHSHKQYDKEVNSRSLSLEDYKQLLSLTQQISSSNNKNHLEKLPEIMVPKYSSHNDLVRHSVEIMKKNDPLLMEAFVRKSLSDYYFDKTMDQVLTKEGNELLNELLSSFSGYSTQYCPKPLIKSSGENTTSWYNKNHSEYIRLDSRDMQNGLREITRFEIGMLDPSSEDYTKVNEMACKTYSNPLKRAKGKAIKSVMGEMVFCKYGSTKWTYVGQINGTSSLGYSIKWLDESVSEEPASSCSKYELIPGDEAHYKMENGDIVRVWITEVRGIRAQIEDIHGNRLIVFLKSLRFK